MKRKKWTRSEKILWLAPGILLALIGAMVLAPRFSRSFEAMLERLGLPTKETPYRTQCQSNLEQISLATMQYAQDYNDKYPLATSNRFAYGWAEALRPYIISSALFHCPKNTGLVSSNPRSAGYTDYYFNANCLGTWLSDSPDSSTLIVIGEGTPSDARSAKSAIPSQWASVPGSPARLHFALGSATRSGANYVFADGHIKWLPPEIIDDKTTRRAPTFSLHPN